MIDKRLHLYLFLLSFLELTSPIRSSFHGQNNGFTNDNNEVQYILDNGPVSIHKDLTNMLHGSGNVALDDKSVQDSIPSIMFEPDILDFKRRQLGFPHQEKVTLINKDDNRTIYLSSISGSTQNFHSSFFQDKIIPPLGNTTFKVVFLGREEGEVKGYLYIRTSDGTLRYKVKGFSISSPYRLRPVIGVKLPFNASFTPFIHVHNPYADSIQVVEVYSGGGEFQLELPSGESEASRELWEIPPYQTKPIIRLRFNAFMEKNYTTYVRFKVNSSVELMIVAVEVEVDSAAGLHWGENLAWINFGFGGSLEPPIHYPITLRNSAKKAVKVLNIMSTPVSKAVTINFEPMIIPSETDIPVTVGTLAYDWKSGQKLNHLKGTLLIKGVEPSGKTQKLSIPWIAGVLEGGLEVNTSSTHYFPPYRNQPRNFSVVNHFNTSLAITNISLADNAKLHFTIKNFVPHVLNPGQEANIFVLIMNNKGNITNFNKLKSSILIYSNISTIEVPLLSYDGKVNKIIPGERDSNRGTLNFGTISSGIEKEAIFALENKNPINIELRGWGVNMPGAVLELMGCQNRPISLFHEEIESITVCSHTSSQSIKPGYLAIFKIKVKTPFVEEETIVGNVFVRTNYERLTIPVYMRVAHGKMFLEKLTFNECFPGSICTKNLKIHSTFAMPMKVMLVESIYKDTRVKYISPVEGSLPIIKRGENNIGILRIDLSTLCRHCYLGFPLNSAHGSQWLHTMNLPSHTRDSDLNVLNSRYSKYLNSTGVRGMWDNITIKLETSEVREQQFQISIKPYWPSILLERFEKYKNESIFAFPLTQVGNTSLKMIKIYNPSIKPLIVQLLMDWAYPQGTRLYHLLPSKFKSSCYNCPATVDGEFNLQEGSEDRNEFKKKWNVDAAPNSIPFILNPGESRNIKLSYTPTAPGLSSGLLFVRNNLTILQVIRLTGHGAHAQFKFGNRKPGSNTPLLFELTEKHLKDCERERRGENPLPKITVKRSFTARNTGELPIDIYGFSINGLHCEGFGFKVLNCESFRLNPNATKKIEIAFSPDFTLSKVERKISILTSLGSDFIHVNTKNGIVQLTLITTLPPHALDICSSVLIRPSWEYVVQWVAICLSCILFLCILAVSFLEADRILRNALSAMSKVSNIHPPLDLRNLVIQQTLCFNPERFVIEKNNNCSVTKNTEPDWGLINGNRGKEKDSKEYMKISHWSVEEKKKFKVDMETKEFVKQETVDIDISVTNYRKKTKQMDLDNELNQERSYSTSIKPSLTIDCNSKKEDTEYNLLNDGIRERKKNLHNAYDNLSFNHNSSNINNDSSSINNSSSVNSSSNSSNTNKPNNNSSNSSISKSGNNSRYNNSYINNNSSCEKCESNTSQKIVHYSEEESSSTTTEGSAHEESLFKDQNFHKQDKIAKKLGSKKNKQLLSPNSNAIDFRDNYEGDCDDDDYDKEKQDDSDRWKINTSRLIAKNCQPAKSGNINVSVINKKMKTSLKKGKNCHKWIDSGKNLKINCVSSEAKSEIKNVGQLPSSFPSPPPLSLKWGQNRAKFSDVVARNSDRLSPSFLDTSGFSVIKINETLKPGYINVGMNKKVSETHGANTDYPSPTAQFSNSHCSALDAHTSHLGNDSSVLKSHRRQRTYNRLCMNSFEHTFEPDLIPYDDLPETDEPLVELECIEEDTKSHLYNNKCSMVNLASDLHYSDMETPNDEEKLANNLMDSLKDNWLTVETNWEPLYTRGAVGEERSGVWGINTGGVWAAAPWGTPTPSKLEIPLLQQPDHNVQELSGFDPFRSLNTIWTPSTKNYWDIKPEE